MGVAQSGHIPRTKQTAAPGDVAACCWQPAAPLAFVDSPLEGSGKRALAFAYGTGARHVLGDGWIAEVDDRADA